MPPPPLFAAPNPFVLFNLGSVYQEQKRLAEALPLFRRSLELSQPSDSIVHKLHALIAQCHNQLGQSADALAACRNGRAQYPDDIELLFQEGIALRNLGDMRGAKERWERVLTVPRSAHFASVNIGIRGYLTRHNLASVNHDLGLFQEAEAQWQTILAERPDYDAAWTGLAEVYLAQERWPEVEGLTQRMQERPNGRLPADMVRARSLLQRKEFERARTLLAETIRHFPQAVEPRRLLSHAYLQEGRDWKAAERALRDVLSLDPENREAQHNLGILVRQQAS